MATQEAMTPEQLEQFQEVRRIMQAHGETNWGMPDDLAITIAQELADVPPDQVLTQAKARLQELKATNLKEKEKRDKARERVAQLKEHPLTNLGQPGLIGYLKRSIVASINATPLIALNFMEVNDKGLQVYTPLAPISQRTFKWRDFTGNRVVLSVNPPAYFDWIFGLFKQLRINLTTPWGGITVYEPGSGRTLAEAVALWPDRRIAEFRAALQQVHLVENPFEGYRRLPRLVDLLGYHVEHWDLRLTEEERDIIYPSGEASVQVTGTNVHIEGEPVYVKSKVSRIASDSADVKSESTSITSESTHVTSESTQITGGVISNKSSP